LAIETLKAEKEKLENQILKQKDEYAILLLKFQELERNSKSVFIIRKLKIIK